MRVTINNTNIKIENGKVIIDFDPEQLTDLICASKVKLSTLKPKDEFRLGDEVFIVLEQTDSGTKVISKGFAYINRSFGNCSDWKKSPIRTLLNEDYYNKIEKLIGADNIISMERDLTSLDGLDDYDTCNDKVSLLSVSEYAKYHKVLGLKSNYSNWWWTITPASTPSSGYSRGSCCVTCGGVLDWEYCDDYSHMVRPFLNLESSILVSQL